MRAWLCMCVYVCLHACVAVYVCVCVLLLFGDLLRNPLAKTRGGGGVRCVCACLRALCVCFCVHVLRDHFAKNTKGRRRCVCVCVCVCVCFFFFADSHSLADLVVYVSFFF